MVDFLRMEVIMSDIDDETMTEREMVEQAMAARDNVLRELQAKLDAERMARLGERSRDLDIRAELKSDISELQAKLDAERARTRALLKLCSEYQSRHWNGAITCRVNDEVVHEFDVALLMFVNELDKPEGKTRR